jgi:tropomyosin-1
MAMAAFNTMTAIKKKMHGMKSIKDNVFDRVDQLEQKLLEHKAISEKHEEEMIVLNKRINQIQSDHALAQQQFTEASAKLEATQKQLAAAEAEMQSLTKRVRAMEEDYESTESRLQATNTKLEQAYKASEESERGRKVLENRIATDEERIEVAGKELEVTILFGEEADRKYEETARKLAITEVDLERSEGRVQTAEAKIIELDDELKVVGNNMKSLEIAQQEALIRQEYYEIQIQNLTVSLQDAENRATVAERNVTLLQKEVDRLEDELGGERDKFRLVLGELDSTFTELTGF